LAELDGDQADGLGVVVGGHDELTSAAPVKEANRKREQLLEDPPHPLQLDAAGQPAREHLSGIDPTRAHQPDGAHDESA
jgi:hypothetical protein